MEKMIKNKKTKVMCAVLAALVVLSGMVGVLSSSRSAYATETTLVDTGNLFDFYQRDSNTGLYWADSSFQLAGQDAYCIDITTTAYAGSSYSSRPMDQTMALKIGLYQKYLAEAHGGWSDMKRGGYLQFMVWSEYSPAYVAANVTPDNGDFYDVYAGARRYYEANRNHYDAEGTEWTSADSQSMCVVPRLTERGSVDLTKTSSLPATTAGNGCYSLAHAVYGIYSDAACTDRVAGIETDAKGYGRADDIRLGGYYVKEDSPAEGYSLDDGVYPVRVESGKTVTVNGGTVSDVPHSDPVGMLVGKVDATTSKSKPESAAKLKGAIFTVEYYDGYYAGADAARASGAATRTWQFATDEDGFAYYSDEYKHSGDDLYRQMNGTTATLPLGTVLITETAAPEGYNLDDGAHGAPKTFAVQITSDGAVGESVYTYNSPVAPDTVERGDYRVEKEVPTTNDEEDQALTRIAVQGVQFQVINDNAGNVVSPDTLKEVVPGGVVTTLTTDENGLATTKSHVPVGWTAALAYGEYTVHEIIPDDVAARVLKEHGVMLIGVDDWKITVSDELQYDPVQIVANHIPQTPITIQKKDATTGKVIPLACSFQIYDATGRLVTYTDHYADKVVDTWTTLSSGKCTLPMKLDEGSYTLVEVQSPEGYVLGAEPVAFTVDEYRTWDNPITVTYEDSPIMGRIEIDKTSSTTAAEVGGAQYRIIAAADIVTGDGTVRAKKGDVMADVTTDAAGHAEVEGLFLGGYTVYETKSAPGYALDTAEHPVELASQGQTVPVVSFAEDVTDKPTTIKILKVDETDATKALPGATFRIWQDVEGGYDEELVTGADGTIGATLLPHGAFHIEEVEAPQGYYLPEDAETVDFKVDDQGFIGLAAEGSQFSDTLALTFDNASTKVDLSKTDIVTGAELPGAKLSVADSAGKTVEEWTSTSTPHRINGLVPGDYTLTEVTAPDGYLTAKAVKFTVAANGTVQKAAMADDYTKTDFSKTDATTGEEIAGAHLKVVDSIGKTVAEWDTDGKPHRINKLVPGDYKFVEMTAPEGYEVSEQVAFTVKETGEIQKVEMKDVRTSEAPETPASGLPKTSDAFPWWVVALLAGAAVCGVGAIALVRRHDDRNDGSADNGEEKE